MTFHWRKHQRSSRLIRRIGWYDQERERIDAHKHRAAREAVALIDEHNVWGLGVPADILVALVAAAWLDGARVAMGDAERMLRG